MEPSHPAGPSAEAQLRFLQQIGRILDEGRFTTTYKFALLIALTNLAIRRGSDDGSPLTVDLDELALEFINIHWGMARPFPGADGKILRFSTNSKKQAAVMASLSQHAAMARATHARLRAYRNKEAALRRKVRRTLTRDVIYRLQSVGESAAGRRDGDDSSVQFMYSHPPDANSCAQLDAITLKPGVPACMRSLRAVIVGMAQARWALWMRLNNPQLGPDRQLETFMFGSSRVHIAQYADWLYELQGGRCFYLGTRIRDPKSAHVDHFLPRARYALDEPANLVLASAAANNDKRDHVASERHLERWAGRNAMLQVPDALAAHPPIDNNTAQSVARWMYSVAERDATLAWDSVRDFQPLTGEWRELLGYEG
jgi:hypothetical protein